VRRNTPPAVDDLFRELAADWRSHANCLGVNAELFFTDRGESTRDAKECCRGCDVRPECLAYALETRQKFGVWGGLSERERRHERRRVAMLKAVS
jgi:WhiB family redox-sensing transcriptional regulator